MRFWVSTVAALAMAVAIPCGAVRAQAPVGPGSPRPAVSPYINLLRRGNTAVNYYGIVRPQVQFYNNIAGLTQQVGTLDAEVARTAQGEVPFPTTGHPAQFMNLSHYFPQPAATGGGTGLPSAPAVRRPAGSR